MEVREIDIHEDAEVRAWWEVSKAADAYGREEYVSFWSLRAATASLRAPNNSMCQVPLAAFEGREIVGVDQLHYPLLDNTHLSYVSPLVLPERRGRGIGSALLDTSLDLIRQLGRTTALCEVNLPLDEQATSPGLDFARRHGFEVGILDLHRVLSLPVEPGSLDALESQAAAHHRAYSLESWIDTVPDEHLRGYCDLQTAFNSEAPSGDLEYEDEAWDEERVRSAEKRHEQQGRRMAATVAIDPEGAVVGLTEMVSTEETHEFAWQGGTLVLKSARGHRLGMAMKVANLRLFETMMPSCRSVHSWNAEANGPMVAINDALGFQPVERLAEMQLKL